MRFALAFLTVLSCGFSTAQDQTNAWLRYAVRVPLDSNWTVHIEPDFRTELAPDARAFTQWLFRNDLQRRLNDVHTLGIGIVGVYNTDDEHRVELFEWRPQLTLFSRPRCLEQRLSFRTRLEWRQQQFATLGENISADNGTLRCRGLVQYEIPFKLVERIMTRGLRNQVEVLVRGYTDADLGTFDQLRISTAWVMPLTKRLEMETAWMWILRENDVVQQWFRLVLTHRL